MDVDAIAKKVLQEAEQEQSDRANFENLWTEIARRVHPRADMFQGRNMTPGTRRSDWQFSSTAALALEKYMAVVIALSMPPSETYQRLVPTERTIRKDQSAMQWCQETRDEVFAMRYSGLSNFGSNITEVVMDAGGFGTGTLFIEDQPGKPTNYRSCGLHNTYHCEGEDGKITRTYRKLEYKPYQAIEKFGVDVLPEIIVKSAETEANKKFCFWQRVQPRAYVEKGIRGPEGMAFESVYISETNKKVVAMGGYRSFPFAVLRGPRAKNEVYGRGPMTTVLADVKMSNEMARSIIRATHRMTEPTLLVADDAALSPFQLKPGHRNKGYITEDGTELAKQLKWEGDLNAATSLAERTELTIRNACMQQVFDLLLQNPGMTATEVLQRLRERGILLTPMASMVDEFLQTVMARELDILAARGRLAPMPEIMQRHGREVDVMPNSPLSRALNMDKALGFSQTLEQVTPIAQVKPDIMQRFKEEAILPELAEIHGMPLDWLYTTDEYAAIQQRQAQQQAMQQAAGAAEPISAALKNAAQARLFQSQAGQ